MTYIDYIGNETVRIGNAVGGGTHPKYLKTPLTCKSDSLNRIHISGRRTGIKYLLSDPSFVVLQGRVYDEASDFVQTFNDVTNPVLPPSISDDYNAYYARVIVDGGEVSSTVNTINHFLQMPLQDNIVFAWFADSGNKVEAGSKLSKLYSFFDTNDMSQSTDGLRPTQSENKLVFDGVDNVMSADITGYASVLVVGKRIGYDDSDTVFTTLTGLGGINGNTLYIGCDATQTYFYEVEIKAIIGLDTVSNQTMIDYLKTSFNILYVGNENLFAKYFDIQPHVINGLLVDSSANGRDFTMTRCNCALGDGTAKLTFTNLPTYDLLTIMEDGVAVEKTLTGGELVLTNEKKYNYAIFSNEGTEVAKFPLMEHDSDYDIEATLNFYDVIGDADCVFTDGTSANISKTDGASWNFLYGFAIVIGNDLQYPKKVGSGYGGITTENIVAYLPYSINANQYIKAPEDAAFVALDTDEQFYDAGTPVNVHLADIYDNDYVAITLDNDVVESIIIN